MRGALAGVGAAFGAANPVPCGMGSALAGAFAVFSAEIVRRARRSNAPERRQAPAMGTFKNDRRSEKRAAVCVLFL